VNVEQLLPEQLAFLMKSKKPHISGGLSSFFSKIFFELEVEKSRFLIFNRNLLK